MKKTRTVLLALIIITLSNIQAQSNNDILLTIHDKKITKDEFLRIYQKNNNSNTIDNKSIDEYLELFINFKLKVIEAEEQGYDTVSSFIKELDGYQKQLVKPYLTDKNVDEALIKEAYDRTVTEVAVSHIMVSLDRNALPEDTLKAYQKIAEIRKRVINGEPFESVARATSDDPSVKKNDGYLGYFTSFKMVYPFETAAYTTPVGEVSKPVKTSFGYHILKVHDKRPAQGEIKVAHIMLMLPQGSSKEKSDSVKAQIDEIYQKAKNNEDFTELAAAYSEDRGTARNGGELPWFSTGRMIEDFSEPAFKLKENGEISKPIQTTYGWHIIKRLDYKPVASYDDLKNDIASKISKDQTRNKLGREAVMEKLKKQYNFTENRETLQWFYNKIDSTIFMGEWKSDPKPGEEVIFSFAGKSFTQNDLFEYITANQRRTKKVPLVIFVNDRFDEFVEKSLIAYEESMLDEKYPEYKYLLEEYHDGILLFNLTDDMVWSKAVKDTVGLEKFYTDNKENYMWGERANATIVKTNDKAQLKTIKKLLKSFPELGKSEIKNAICDTSNLDCIVVEEGKFSKGENDVVDEVNWKQGVSKPIQKSDLYIIVNIKEIMPPAIKKLNETRGIVTADYQNYLEKQWVDSLREKYQIEVDQDVLSSIKQ